MVALISLSGVSGTSITYLVMYVPHTVRAGDNCLKFLSACIIQHSFFHRIKELLCTYCTVVDIPITPM